MNRVICEECDAVNDAEYVIDRCKKCDAEISVYMDSEENLVDI